MAGNNGIKPNQLDRELEERQGESGKKLFSKTGVQKIYAV